MSSSSCRPHSVLLPLSAPVDAPIRCLKKLSKVGSASSTAEASYILIPINDCEKAADVKIVCANAAVAQKIIYNSVADGADAPELHTNMFTSPDESPQAVQVHLPPPQAGPQQNCNPACTPPDRSPPILLLSLSDCKGRANTRLSVSRARACAVNSLTFHPLCHAVAEVLRSGLHLGGSPTLSSK